MNARGEWGKCGMERRERQGIWKPRVSLLRQVAALLGVMNKPESFLKKVSFQVIPSYKVLADKERGKVDLTYITTKTL